MINLTCIIQVYYAKYVHMFREKVRSFIQRLKTAKRSHLLIVVILVLAIPLTVYVAQKQQEIRQRASTNQATITVNPTTVKPSESVTVSWTLASPAATVTPAPTTAACSSRPNVVRNVTVDNVNKVVNVTATAGTNADKPTNTLTSIKFTRIDNATLEVPTDWILTNPEAPTTPIYTFPANTTSVSFKEKRIACGAVTVEYTWIDDCGEFNDFSGAGTGTTGLTCDAAFNGIPKAYAQNPTSPSSLLTGSETLQLFRIESTNTYPTGPKMYLNCQYPDLPGVGANPAPPTTPMYTGQCTYTIPKETKPDTYLIRMLAADETTILGESPPFDVMGNETETLSSGLTSYWTLDETEGNIAYDSIVHRSDDPLADPMYSNNGTVFDATVVVGKINHARQFTATTSGTNQYIQLFKAPHAEEFTVSAWIFPSDQNSFGASNSASIFNWRNNLNTGGMSLELDGDEGNGEMRCDVWIKRADTSEITMQRSITKKGEGLKAGIWNHITCSYSKEGRIKIAINGKVTNTDNDPLGTRAYAGTVNNTPNNNAFVGFCSSNDSCPTGYRCPALTENCPAGTACDRACQPIGTPSAVLGYIGKNIVTDQSFAGVIDEVGWWNRPLIDKEIEILASGKRPPFENNPPPIQNNTFTVTTSLTGIGKETGNPSPKHPTRNAIMTVFDAQNNPVFTYAGNLLFNTASGIFEGKFGEFLLCLPNKPCVLPGTERSHDSKAQNSTTVTDTVATNSQGEPTPLLTCNTDADCPRTTAPPSSKCFKHENQPGTCRPADTVCAGVVTRACIKEEITCALGMCVQEKCVDFPNPCVVPPGWTKEGEPRGCPMPMIKCESNETLVIGDPQDANACPQYKCLPTSTNPPVAGSYTIKIQTPQFLRKQIPGIFSIKPGEKINLPAVTLITGDINYDNKINILDYNFIVSCFGKKINSVSCIESPQFTNGNPLADLNDDGVVDGIDYNLFIRSIATQEGD